MSSVKLTPRQQAVLDFIQDYIRQRQFSPSMREIAQHFSFRSTNGVTCHLRALEKKGLIRRNANLARAIELVDSPDRESGLPMVGYVAAGFTNLAFELPTERFDLAGAFDNREYFVLGVRGDSMIEAHIEDGDHVICKKAEDARPGQMVVARTPEGEATLKYWHPEAKRIRLQPANSAMEPIYVKQATVQGVVVGVVRSVPH